MEACAGKGSLIFSLNRGVSKRGMKEIRGGCLGLLVLFKREGEYGRVRRIRSGNRWGELERLVLFGQRAGRVGGDGERWLEAGERRKDFG